MLRPDRFIDHIPDVTTNLVAVSEQDPENLMRTWTMQIAGYLSGTRQASVELSSDDQGLVNGRELEPTTIDDLADLRHHQGSVIMGTRHEAMELQQMSFNRGLRTMIQLAELDLSFLDRDTKKLLGATALDFTRRAIRVSTLSKVIPDTTGLGNDQVVPLDHAQHIARHSSNYEALLPYADRRMRKWTKGFLSGAVSIRPTS
jgi:hypothetical protein